MRFQPTRVILTLSLALVLSSSLTSAQVEPVARLNKTIELLDNDPVSYTHLTLPTICSV